VLVRPAADGGDGGGGDAALQSVVEDDLAAMGFAAPVTKEQAGRRYHKELARQVLARKYPHTQPLTCEPLACMQTESNFWHANLNVSKVLI